ncbi:hypothetical protein GJAV_G00056020 [Gymnothorax javanicus]|nr:hypothetical protein GJAV_G00056020 [Gymnothorax javanicus]
MAMVSPSKRDPMDSTHPQAVLASLNEQRTQGLFCDVTIVVEDVKFRAHRNILAASSGYFREAFSTPESPPTPSGQVLELLDLRSEIFASILNFIYSSKIATISTEDTRSLIAAGKKLGIPFLEKLMGLDRLQNQTQVSPGPHLLKKETTRLEESEVASGPRITNAFSITEAGADSNPFNPLDLRCDGQQIADQGNSLALSTATVDSEPAQTLSEHSYAVTQTRKATEHNDSSIGNDKTDNTHVQATPSPQATESRGPLKKRHKLRGTLMKNTPATQNELGTPKETSGSCHAPLSASVSPVISSLSSSSSSAPSSMNSDIHTSGMTAPPAGDDPSAKESAPPVLSPSVKSNVFRCEYCPETFSNKAVLNIHMQVHKRRFVSHLYCKFCHRKFMHLKRLRNHEHVCTKAQRPLSEQVNDNTEINFTTECMPPMEGSLLPAHQPDMPDSTSPLIHPEKGQDVNRGLRTGLVGQRRLYPCSVCKRSYVTQSSLRRHENVHSWQRAYPCHYCNKVFALAEYRTKHEIWHTGERRYQCIFCLETFMTYYILKNHQKSFHGIDPRLSVNKKSASMVNGGFKGSVYPIKLYRLLPMKFRKRRYKTYNRTFPEVTEGNDQIFPAPLCCNSPSATPEENLAAVNADGISGEGPPVFSMPVTFMATPNVIAAVTPRINFDQPCDQGEPQLVPSEATEGVRPLRTSRDKQMHIPLGGVGKVGPTMITNRPRLTTDTMQNNRVSSVIVHSNNIASTEFKHSDEQHIRFREMNPDRSLEAGNRLGDLSAAAQTIEALANQLFSPGGNCSTLDKPDGKKTETYIAKPACPGTSIDSPVLPLCQITVKIGDEAIIRRRIKGSKLFPKKKRRSHWSQMGEENKSNFKDPSEKSPSLRLRTEITSIIETEPYDDATDRDTADQLWRPYYTYKPKKRTKKLRSKDRKSYQSRQIGRPLKDVVHPHGPKNMTECLDAPLEPEETSNQLRKSTQKKMYTCDICKSPFFSLSTLRSHVRGCHPFFCRTCGKQCPPGEAANLHFPFPEDGEDFVCKSCMEDGSCFDNPARSPNREKRYRCSFCPQRFLYLATKKSHERKHIEVHGKGYNCYYCPMVCKTAISLGAHQKRHLIKTEEHMEEEGRKKSVNEVKTRNLGEPSDQCFCGPKTGEADGDK